MSNIKRLLHDIFHIGPNIRPRLPYQARQRSWGVDMDRGLITGPIWKIPSHNLFITYFTLTFSSVDFYITEKIFEMKNCENKSFVQLPNIFVSNLVSKRYQTMSICTMMLESVCKIYPRRRHLIGNSYSTRCIHLN